ncbi:MAG TPA: hypothetical protein VFG09_15235 [Thermodesulfovibrionales bacterium]|nr:hypothetical protein [Thermodesulfovibrionales bacterium]
MGKWSGPGTVLFALILAACTSTFLVSKDGKGYFLGSKTNDYYKMLCESGDLKKVLRDTHFDQTLQDDLYKYNCSPERSGEKVRQIYASMSSEQRRDLRRAFTKNGYDINYMPC